MTPRRRHGFGTNAILTVLTIVIVGAGIGAAAYIYQANTTTPIVPSTQSTTTPAVNDTSSVSLVNGLQLNLGVSTTTTLSVSLSNTLATTLNLTPGTMSLSLGPCSQLPLGVAIYSGYYNAGNISMASPLDLYQPGAYNCPAMFAVSGWSFAPMSDSVTLVSQQPTGSGNTTTPEDMWTQPVATNIQLTGYWTVQSNNSSVFHAFPPGTYTALAEDEWGNTKILTFLMPFDASTMGSSSA